MVYCSIEYLWKNSYSIKTQGQEQMFYKAFDFEIREKKNQF